METPPFSSVITFVYLSNKEIKHTAHLESGAVSSLWRGEVGDTVAFRLDLEGSVILNPSASALPLTKHSCFLSPNCSPRGPSFFFFFFWRNRRRKKDHPEQKRLSILSCLESTVMFCKEKDSGKYSKWFFKSSEDGQTGSEDNIMIRFSGGSV